MSVSDQKNIEIIGTKSLIALSNAVLGSAFTFGWAMGVLNLPEPYIKCWLSNIGAEDSNNCSNAIELNNEGKFDDTTLEWALSTAILPLGAVIGGVFGGVIANKYGRKTGMLLNAIYLIIISIGLGLVRTINSLEVFLVLRFLLGTNIGISSSIAPLYINEISPQQYKGAFGACFQFGVTVGIVISNLFGLNEIMGTDDLWPILLGINGIPAAFQAVLCLMSPESPIYLLSKGDTLGAKAANKALKGPNAVLDESNVIEDVSIITNIKDIFANPPVKKATIVCICLMLAQQLCGINAIFFYSGSIFKNAGIPQSSAGYATVGLSTINVVFVGVAIAFSDKLGRKLLLNIAYVIMTICAVLTTVALSFKESEIASYLSIVPVCLFVAAFEIGPGPLPWAAAGESIPSQYKAGTQSLTVATNWFCAFLVGLIFPPMQENLDQWVFLPFAVVCVIAVIYISKAMVETKGKTIEEVQEEYSSK